MKSNMLLLFLLFINFINSNDLFGSDYYAKLRNLWDNDLEYESRYSNESKSLSYCANSSPKYFAYILTGYPYTFDSYIDEGYGVSNK